MTVLGKNNLISVGTATVIILSVIHITVMFVKIENLLEDMVARRWTVEDMERYVDLTEKSNPNLKLPDPHEIVKKRKQYEIAR